MGNKPTTPHGGRADVDSNKTLNTDQDFEEVLQTGVNAINEGSNANHKPQRSQTYPTKFGMQLNDIDSDIHRKGNKGNVQDMDSKSSIPPRRTELIGEYEDEFNKNQNSTTDWVQLNEFHATRIWKRIECEPHVHNQSPNSQNPTKKKRSRKDGETDLPELQNKKINVWKAEVQEISMVEAAGQPRQEQ